MDERPGGVTGWDMLTYGFKPGEPWAEERRALEQAFREHDAQNSTRHMTYRNLEARTRMSSEFDGGGTLDTMIPVASRQRSAAYLYSDAGDNSDYEEAPSVSSVAHSGQRVTSDNGYRSGIMHPRHDEGQYLYSSRRPEYDEDVRVSPMRWGGHGRSSWRDDLSESYDPPHARGDRDSDWEDGHQGDGSGGSPGMFDPDQERWFGSSEYDDHQAYDNDSEGDYYYDSGSEAYENESHYGSEYFAGSSGGEESYASESDVGSDWSYEVYYYDSD